jgi:uncharacterized membrane protein
MRLPARTAPILFGFFLTLFMTFIVSGIATVRAVGLGGGFLTLWMSSWFASWAVAFPVVLVVAPAVRRLVARLTQPA